MKLQSEILALERQVNRRTVKLKKIFLLAKSGRSNELIQTKKNPPQASSRGAASAPLSKIS